MFRILPLYYNFLTKSNCKRDKKLTIFFDLYLDPRKFSNERKNKKKKKKEQKERKVLMTLDVCGANLKIKIKAFGFFLLKCPTLLRDYCLVDFISHGHPFSLKASFESE
jgi:hypothetical protein